jgi:pimeloyl-ACP methyl ester carboxylesterase
MKNARKLAFATLSSLLSALALSGCGNALTPASNAPTVPGTTSPLPNQDAESELIPASAATQKTLAIKQWKLTAVSSNSVATQTFGVEGRDANGVVVLSATLAAQNGDNPATRQITVRISTLPAATATAATSEIMPKTDQRIAQIASDVVGLLEERERTAKGKPLPASYNVGAALNAMRKSSPVQTRDINFTGDKDFLKAMNEFSVQAYVPADSVADEYRGCQIVDGMKSDIFKFYACGPTYNDYILAFAGTRPGLTGEFVGDFLRDIEAEAMTSFTESLSQAVAIHPNRLTAQGFLTRTENIVGRNGFAADFRDVFSIADQHAKIAAFPFTLHIVGHSLGGAAAELAGQMFSDYFLRQNIAGLVRVYSFESPRIGFVNRYDFAKAGSQGLSWYGDSLIAGQAGSQDVRDRLIQGLPLSHSLVIRKFSRRFDPVSSVPALRPLFAAKPAVWVETNNVKRTGEGLFDRSLNYCPMYYSTKFMWNPHSNDWGAEIDEMPNDHLNCMLSVI